VGEEDEQVVSENTHWDPGTVEHRLTSATGGQKGVKRARYDLIPADFLRELAEVYGFGAEKYDDFNWRKGYDWRLSYGALMRHLYAWRANEERDPESGYHHLAHVAWHAATLFVYSRDMEYQSYDDRPQTF
jgi:hypothetical protein